MVNEAIIFSLSIPHHICFGIIIQCPVKVVIILLAMPHVHLW